MALQVDLLGRQVNEDIPSRPLGHVLVRLPNHITHAVGPNRDHVPPSVNDGVQVL
jgi:hypothetical protein